MEFFLSEQAQAASLQSQALNIPGGPVGIVNYAVFGMRGNNIQPKGWAAPSPNITHELAPTFDPTLVDPMDFGPVTVTSFNDLTRQ